MEEILKALAAALAAELIKNEDFVNAIAAKAAEKVDVVEQVEDALNGVDFERKVNDAIEEIDIDRRIESAIDDADIEGKCEEAMRDAMRDLEADDIKGFEKAVKHVIREALE